MTGVAWVGVLPRVTALLGRSSFRPGGPSDLPGRGKRERAEGRGRAEVTENAARQAGSGEWGVGLGAGVARSSGLAHMGGTGGNMGHRL
ncbi:hypothetical protein GCM10022255_013350 [Dactylosporangium darangshiense]|uniref:Uncharacterized protein n=1 Tax=Dactylosporangium darangshiense TaxID=579108 RepID=A0ABP8D035_9ACTN